MREGAEEGRLTLRIDDSLLDAGTPPELTDDSEFDSSVAWAPLRLVVSISDVGVRRFRWDPLATMGLTAFAALVVGYSVTPGEQFDCDLEAFFEGLNDPREWERTSRASHSGPVSARIAELRAAHLGSWSAGINADSLDQYLAEWEPILNGARQTLVPANAPDQDLELSSSPTSFDWPRVVSSCSPRIHCVCVGWLGTCVECPSCSSSASRPAWT